MSGMKRGSLRFSTAILHELAGDMAADRGMTRSGLFTARLGKGTRLARAIWRPEVDYWTADELACALGLHPMAIWPEFDRVWVDELEGAVA